MAVGSNRHFPVLTHYVNYFHGFLGIFEHYGRAAAAAQKEGLLPKEVRLAVLDEGRTVEVRVNQLTVRVRMDWLHNPPLGRARSALVLGPPSAERLVELDCWTFDLHGNVFERGQEQQTSLYSLTEPGDAAELLSRALIAGQARAESEPL